MGCISTSEKIHKGSKKNDKSASGYGKKKGGLAERNFEVSRHLKVADVNEPKFV